MKGQLDRLNELIKRCTGILFESTYRFPSFSLQPTLHSLVRHSHPSHEPYIPIASNVPVGVYRPNWQPRAPIPAIAPAFVEISRPVSQASSSSTNLGKLRMSKDKTRSNPIPVTYIELLPKLLESQHIALSHAPHFKSLFPKWYNANVWCDYMLGTQGI